MSGSITLERSQVDWLLRGALAAAEGRNGWTALLQAVRWTVDEKWTSVAGTDRYRVHELRVPTPPGTPEGAFTMSRSQASRLLTSWHTPRRQYRDQVAVLEWSDPSPIPVGTVARVASKYRKQRRYAGTVRFRILASSDADADEVSCIALQPWGKFPPVGRLFDGVDVGDPVASTGLNPEFLSDMRWLRSGHGSLRFFPPRVAEGKKSAMLLVENTEGTARALIAANVLPSDAKRWTDA